MVVPVVVLAVVLVLVDFDVDIGIIILIISIYYSFSCYYFSFSFSLSLHTYIRCPPALHRTQACVSSNLADPGSHHSGCNLVQGQVQASNEPSAVGRQQERHRLSVLLTAYLARLKLVNLV